MNLGIISEIQQKISQVGFGWPLPVRCQRRGMQGAGNERAAFILPKTGCHYIPKTLPKEAMFPLHDRIDERNAVFMHR